MATLRLLGSRALLVAVLLAATSAAQASEALYVKGTLRFLRFGNTNPGPTTAVTPPRTCPCSPSAFPLSGPIDPTSPMLGGFGSAVTTGTTGMGDPAVPVGGAFKLFPGQFTGMGGATIPPGLLPPSLLTVMTTNDVSNGLGQFSSGGGPGAGVVAPLASTSFPPSGTRTLTVISRPASLFSAVITPGPRQFGGTMGILGGFSVTWTATSTGFPSGNLVITSPSPFPNPAVPSTQAGTGTATGKVVLVHTVQNFTVPSWINVWGKNWTTGSATAIALTGSAQTSSTAMGFDVITALGHRNIQLVTPALTAYTTPLGSAVEGGNNVLNLTFAPEPGASAMLGFGVAALGLIHSVRRRRITRRSHF